MKTSSLTRFAVTVSALALIGGVAWAQPPMGGFGGPGGGRGGFGGGPGGFNTETKVLAQFDKDGDGKLDTAERAQARAYLEGQGGGRRGGPPGGGFGGGRGGGRGGPGGGGIVAGKPGAQIAPTSVKTYPAAVAFYDANTVRTLFIDFENRTDWEAELASFNNTDVDIPVTLTVDGKAYKEVGVHFRGASSFSMIPAGNKRSLALDLEYGVKDQKLLGYKSLNLLNANSDPTFVRTVLYSMIARDYMAAPKVNFVRVVINGEDWGIFLNAQQENKDMLKEVYSDGDGARWAVPGSPGGRGGLEYLGEDPAAYKSLYEIKTKDDPADWAKFITLTKVLNQTPADQLEAKLSPLLDIDETLRFLAIDDALDNSDGYWTRASDYNIYLDSKGRFHVYPHDMNEALGAEGNARLDPLVGLNDTTKPLRSKLLAVPALREKYLAYVKDIATKWLDWNRLGPIVAQQQALIEPVVMGDTRKLYSSEAFKTDVANLESFVGQRRAYLLQ